MRIIGGTARGLRLAEVGTGDAAAHLRPTADRVREAMFNLLINGGYGSPVQGARVLDVFAGTGALGLESLSRGAAQASFIENGASALRLLQQNIALMRAQDRTTIWRCDATKPPPQIAGPFDLIFLDPPYGKNLGAPALAALAPVIAPDALIVWEESRPPAAVPHGLIMLDQRRYGDTVVSILHNPA